MAANQISNRRHAQSGNQRPQSRQNDDESQHEQGPMGQIAEYASDYYAQGQDYLRDMTREREGTAVGLALAAGFGFGLMLGCALVRSHQQERSWRERLTDEGIGRRLMDRIERMVPNALAEHFAK